MPKRTCFQLSIALRNAARISCKTVSSRLTYMKDRKLSQQSKIMPFTPKLTSKDPCREIPWGKFSSSSPADCRIAEVLFMVSSLLSPGLHDIRSSKIQSFNRAFLSQWFQLPIFWRVVWNNHWDSSFFLRKITQAKCLWGSAWSGQAVFCCRRLLEFHRLGE